jgi:hypothetical protein
VEHADEQLRLLPATIETEDELVQVALEVLGADAVEGAPEPSFEVSEYRVRPRQHGRGLTRELDALLVIGGATWERAQPTAGDFEKRPDVPIRGRRETQDVFVLPMAARS